MNAQATLARLVPDVELYALDELLRMFTITTGGIAPSAGRGPSASPFSLYFRLPLKY